MRSLLALIDVQFFNFFHNDMVPVGKAHVMFKHLVLQHLKRVKSLSFYLFIYFFNCFISSLSGHIFEYLVVELTVDVC